MRFDKFDCQTYIESVLALAYARSRREVRRYLVEFRYRGAVTYCTRNHFLLASWVPWVCSRGLLQDDTRRVGGDARIEVQVERMPLRARVCELARAALAPEKRAAACHAIERHVPREVRRTLAWIPLPEIVRADPPFKNGLSVRSLSVNVSLIERIQPGSVLVVRSPQSIHLGFAVIDRGRWRLRTASQNRGSVQEYDLVAIFQTFVRLELADAIAVLAPAPRDIVRVHAIGC